MFVQAIKFTKLVKISILKHIKTNNILKIKKSYPKILMMMNYDINISN